MSLKNGLKAAVIGMGVGFVSASGINLRGLELENLSARLDGFSICPEVIYLAPLGYNNNLYNEELLGERSSLNYSKVKINSIQNDKEILKKRKSEDLSFIHNKNIKYGKNDNKKFYKVSGGRVQKFR